MSKPQIFVIVKVSPDGRGGCDQVIEESFLYEADAAEKILDLRCLREYLNGGIDYEIEEVDFTE